MKICAANGPVSKSWQRFPSRSWPVNGHAIAGGAILPFACDQRILARGPAQIGLTEVRVGVLFPAWRSRSLALRYRHSISLR